MYTGYVKEGVYQPGDAGTEEKEDTDADNDADGEGVKPTSTTSASIAPPSSVVTPVVFLVNGIYLCSTKTGELLGNLSGRGDGFPKFWGSTDIFLSNKSLFCIIRIYFKNYFEKHRQ